MPSGRVEWRWCDLAVVEAYRQARRPKATAEEVTALPLTEAEVRFAMATEWAETAEDMLWRRSKLGLHLNAEAAAELAAFMQAQRPTSVPHRTAGART